MLHNLGREFGATTGRKRRCGWFDAVATRYAGMINGIDELAITNLDGLDHVDPIRVCVGYRLNGKPLDVPPCDASQLANCEPVYEEMRGWNTPTHSARKFSQLPSAARKYVKYISELTGAKLSMVSVGPARGETIVFSDRRSCIEPDRAKAGSSKRIPPGLRNDEARISTNDETKHKCTNDERGRCDRRRLFVICFELRHSHFVIRDFRVIQRLPRGNKFQKYRAATMSASSKNVPRHIAIIMDGNGRWAKGRGLPRIKGHEAGAQAVRECVEGCGELKVEYLTLYAFLS